MATLDLRSTCINNRSIDLIELYLILNSLISLLNSLFELILFIEFLELWT